MLYPRRERGMGDRASLGSATLRAAGLRALGSAIFVALTVGAVGYSQASANQDDCKDSQFSKALRKACKKQAEAQQDDAMWSRMAGRVQWDCFASAAKGSTTDVDRIAVSAPTGRRAVVNFPQPQLPPDMSHEFADMSAGELLSELRQVEHSMRTVRRPQPLAAYGSWTHLLRGGPSGDPHRPCWRQLDGGRHGL